jgi:DNA-binding PadR family transcriptional regulator
VRQEIETRTGRPVSIGALYATRARLDAKGLVNLRTVTVNARQRGRVRRYCRLTASGTRALWHSATMLTRMMDGLQILRGEGR